ncbi:CCA tRNA nucleotidyltransferase [bacterium]|nr:CCA tRNA nucleotidyltransferase [bacterium]
MSINLQKEFNSYINKDYKSAINAAILIAEKYNIKIYLIGGIVRDLIMINSIKDIDITVEGNAIDFCNLLEKESNFKIIKIQENLKTAKVVYTNGTEIDFASTREEKYDIAGNLPVAYNFGCKLEQDVKRRDFTINTLAICLSGDNKYNLIDYYKGFNDIQNRQIKILHNKSFIDDPSRIIRALKFMVRFNFNIEEETQNLINEYLINVNNLMPLERIKNEFHQYFSIDLKNIYQIIINFQAYKLVSDNVILAFNNDYYDDIMQYNLIAKENKWFLYFLLMIFKSDYATERLNLNSEEKKSISDLRELYYSKIRNDNFSIYKAFKDKSGIVLAAYYIITGSNYIKKYIEELKDIKVLINGNDLISLGLKPSKIFNEIFDEILKEKLNGKLETKEDEIAFAKEFVNKHK